ncbi:MAG: Long-chain-fatty-acid--CoA ligase FadD17 [Acidimicrobiales bacterium]|nr:Long-chain-fatty-acid--CoA ligase FadD17 [Acidimicrobiales bacterium]
MDEGTDTATVAALLAARAGDDHAGLLFEDQVWSWRDVVVESARRADLARALRAKGPFHVGVLLENVPEYLFWLGGAAFSGATVVGINPTRRGAELGRDITHTDCQLIVTDTAGRQTLDALDLAIPPERVLVIDSPGYAGLLGQHDGAAVPEEFPDPSTLIVLLFTSGSTGAPKAVKCSQQRLAMIGTRASVLYTIVRDDVCYCAMPFFHGNAIMAVWAPALAVGATFATRRKFSASGFLPDARRFGATFFNYVGKSLAYVLATPEQPDDAENPLQRGFGTEASERDIAEFQRRFDCRVVEGYGSSEGGATITRVPDMPAGALGLPPNETTFVLDPATGEECPRARFDGAGRLLNAEAVGEIVNKGGAPAFEGYYNNPEAEAERLRNGWYWTGDLGYRDEAGWFWFAGRSSDWLRVDSENFGAAPIERILLRHPDVVMAAVYAVPDPHGGDQVMAALELGAGATFDPTRFAEHLAEQSDLGTKWSPRFVRITDAMPLTGTNKVMKRPLQEDGWDTTDPVWWRPARDDPYRPLTDADRGRLRAELAASKNPFHVENGL